MLIKLGGRERVPKGGLRPVLAYLLREKNGHIDKRTGSAKNVDNRKRSVSWSLTMVRGQATEKAQLHHGEDRLPEFNNTPKGSSDGRGGNASRKGIEQHVGTSEVSGRGWLKHEHTRKGSGRLVNGNTEHGGVRTIPKSRLL